MGRNRIDEITDLITSLLRDAPVYDNAALRKMREDDERFMEQITEKDLTFLNRIHVSL